MKGYKIANQTFHDKKEILKFTKDIISSKRILSNIDFFFELIKTHPSYLKYTKNKEIDWISSNEKGILVIHFKNTSKKISVKKCIDNLTLDENITLPIKSNRFYDDFGKLKFGKYKGRELSDIITKDEKYIGWSCENIPGFKEVINNYLNKI